MGGAVAVTAVSFRFIIGRGRPLLATELALLTKRDIDIRLVG